MRGFRLAADSRDRTFRARHIIFHDATGVKHKECIAAVHQQMVNVCVEIGH
jgi:hypothetical protein